MAVCETCGNDYPKAFEVVMGGRTHTFDSFQCAIHSLAPRCEQCGLAILGKGVEQKGAYYCSQHCADAG